MTLLSGINTVHSEIRSQKLKLKQRSHYHNTICELKNDSGNYGIILMTLGRSKANSPSFIELDGAFITNPTELPIILMTSLLKRLIVMYHEKQRL